MIVGEREVLMPSAMRYLYYGCLAVLVIFLFGLGHLYGYVYDAYGPVTLAVLGLSVIAGLCGLLRLVE
jgi:hypothetical protein